MCWCFTNRSSIWSFNVGDSRAVLCRDGKAIDLTLDHKPNDAKEKQEYCSLVATCLGMDIWMSMGGLFLDMDVTV